MEPARGRGGSGRHRREHPRHAQGSACSALSGMRGGRVAARPAASAPTPGPGRDRPGEGRPDIGMCGELSIEDRPEQRPQAEAILRRQEMDGAADRGDPDHAPLDQQRPELRLRRTLPSATRGPCTDLPAPVPGVRRDGAPSTRVEGPAGEEQLPLQRRPVEGSRGDRVHVPASEHARRCRLLRLLTARLDPVR